jgi:hypothetical protein
MRSQVSHREREQAERATLVKQEKLIKSKVGERAGWGDRQTDRQKDGRMDSCGPS